MTIASLLLLGGLIAPGASDAAPVEATLGSSHFVVHYMTGGDPPAATPVTPQMAQKVVTDAEAAYAFYAKLGLPAPLSDAAMGQLPGRRTVRSGGMRWASPWWDGRIDIYVTRLGGGLLGRTISGSTAVAATPGMVLVDYRATTRTTAHELFHLIQLAIFRRATLDILLGEALANWGAYRFIGQGPAPAPQPLGQVGPDALAMPWASLDCRSNCGRAGRRGGYDQWPFFMYLSERFGDGVIEEILNRSAALGATDRKPHGFEAISGALATHGSGLTRAFGDYTAARLDGSFKHPLLAGKTMTVNTKLIATRRRPSSVELVVGHLAARAIILRARGGGRNCVSRRVKLSVGGPPASSARSFVARLGTRALELNPIGNRARLVAKLGACGKHGARLAVANLAPSGPEQTFTVSARVLRAKRR